MANRTISLITYATDGTVNTAVTPTVTVSYAGAAASTLTPTENGNYYNVTIDDTQDATILISGTGLTSDHLVFPRIPEARIADAVWDEVLTGAMHNVASSAGRRLRQLAATIVTDGIAQAAGTNGNQIRLAATASATDGAYDPSVIAIVTGTGAGQCRNILEYDGTTRTATVDRDWKVTPDSTSEYIIYADAGREHVNEGLAQGGSATSITLNAQASSVDNAYIGEVVFIRSGTASDEARRVVDYDGTTKVATVDSAWDVTPDTTSAYVMLPTARLTDEYIADALAAYGVAHVSDIEALPAAVDVELTASHGSGTWGAAAPSEWVTINEDTLDDDGVVMGPMDSEGVQLFAINAIGQTSDTSISEGDGGFTLVVPPNSTYTIKAYRVNYSYDDRTVTV